jgi:long-chain acyl-CoA synthetase
MFISVPRLWNRLYDKVMAAINASGGIKKSLFETAFESKVEGLKEGYLTHAVWDALVFKAIRDRLGGRVTRMVSGAAPLSETVHTFLRVCFGVPVRHFRSCNSHVRCLIFFRCLKDTARRRVLRG